MGAVVVNDPQPPLREGMVGRARSGDLAGFVVQIERFTDESWLLYYSNPNVTDEEAKLGRDRGDTLLHTDAGARRILGEYLDVEWLSGAEAAEIVEAFFNNPEPPAPTPRDYLGRLADWWHRNRHR